MKLLPAQDLLEDIRGIEEGLRNNQKAGRLGAVGVIVSCAQLAIGGSGLLGDSSGWGRRLLVGVGLFVLAASLALVTRSRLWLRESSQPFRYTCSLVEFRALGQVAEKAFSELPVWMQYDLAEMLSGRIGRLSFVDKDEPDKEPAGGGTGEHIRITGDFLVRRKADESWVIEVAPRVQVGGRSAPATLAHPVQFVCARDEHPSGDPSSRLETSAAKLTVGAGERLKGSIDATGEASSGQADGPLLERTPTLLSSDYEKIVERVYFSVATQIYRQIQMDVRRKIGLLPTRFLRATAHYHEADDYARSNTLDALDAARELFEAAMRLYDPRLRPVPARAHRPPYLVFVQWRTRKLVPLRLRAARRWPRMAKGEVMAARSEIGYADTLLYRRTLAGLSGHRMNSIYEARPISEHAIERLKTVPIDVPGCRQALFDAYVTRALACYQLELTLTARESLAKARSLLPTRYEDDARYLYVAGVLEPRARFAIRLLRQAVERNPRFEVAQFELAHRTEMMWRTRSTFERSVAEMIQDEYNLVLRINPGNLRAWANIAYVHWLLGDLERAADAYERGREYKQMKRDATVAALEYGLARVAAEQGRCDAAYRHYLNASSAQLVQGVSDTKWTSAQFYFFDFIGEPMIKRYTDYFSEATRKLDASAQGSDGSSEPPCDPRVLDIVRSFVHNDYGEACHTYYIRNCSDDMLAEATRHYGEAKRLNPDAMLPRYNLYLLHMYEEDVPAAIRELERLQQLEPGWPDGILALVAAKAEAAQQEQTSGPSTGQPAPAGSDRPGTAGLGRLAVWRSHRSRGGDGAGTETSAVAARGQEGGDPETPDAVKNLRALLPHEWLWRSDADGDFDWDAVHRAELERARRWERELDDLHVRALFIWVLLHLQGGAQEDDNRSVTSTTARRGALRGGRPLDAAAQDFLTCIRTHFWPGNFSVLLTARQLDPNAAVREDMRETMRWWLQTDPRAYWALDLLTTDFRDRQDRPLEIFTAEERRHYLEAALTELPEDADLRKWVVGKLDELPDRSAAPIA